MVVVIKERCPQNHPCPCVRICPAKAISQKGYGAPVIDQSLCTKCGKCVQVCPLGAMRKD